jgi:hypothetical protein
VTAFTPDISLAINGVNYTGLVDYSFNIQVGGNALDQLPQPGVISGTLFGEWDTAFTLAIGDKIQVGDHNVSTLGVGVVTDYTISATSGLLGNVTRCDFTAMGALNYLLNSTWYCPGYTDTATGTVLLDILNQAGSQSWEETDPSLTWNDVDPSLAWNNWASATSTLLNEFTIGGNVSGYKITIAAGYRDVMEDLNTLILGSHSLMWEAPDGRLWVNIAPTTNQGATLTINSNEIGRDLATVVSKSDIRNSIDITWTGGTNTYSEAPSVYTYGVSAGSLTTLLNNSGDVDTLGSYLLDSHSYPQNALTELTVDFTNPNFTLTERTNLVYYANPYVRAYATSGVPAAFGGDRDYLIAGHRTEISKGRFTKTLNLVPRENFFTSILWNQVSPSYTWTSYGTANPTQAWSDL